MLVHQDQKLVKESALSSVPWLLQGNVRPITWMDVVPKLLEENLAVFSYGQYRSIAKFGKKRRVIVPITVSVRTFETGHCKRLRLFNPTTYLSYGHEYGGEFGF